jgi:uncharacterized membrane protein
MFYYESWLQSSPPLFLLLVRASVAVFGLTNAILRTVPLFMGLLAALSMFVLCRRLFARPYAMLAWAMFVLSQVAIEYSQTLKQYSSELAASTTILLLATLYVEKPKLRCFWLLTSAIVVGLFTAYSLAFVIPGIVLMICMSPARGSSNPRGLVMGRLVRAFVLAAASGATLAGIYVTFIAPNSPEVLRRAWSTRARKNTGQGFARVAASEGHDLLDELPLYPLTRRPTLLLVSAAATVLAGMALAWLRFRKGRRKWLEIQVVCLSPLPLLFIAEWLTWYPFTDRTVLFAVPFLIVLLVSCIQLLGLLSRRILRDAVKPLLGILLLCGFIVILAASHRTNSNDFQLPMEDADSAVSFLQAHVQPGDFLWIHASCSEVFKLYARMSNWQNQAHFGRTGWPCCPRGVADPLATSSEALVRADFGAALRAGFSGKVWLLYTKRFWHWHDITNEPQIMRTVLRERGCAEMPSPSFREIAAASFNCSSR